MAVGTVYMAQLLAFQACFRYAGCSGSAQVCMNCMRMLVSWMVPSHCCHLHVQRQRSCICKHGAALPFTLRCDSSCCALLIPVTVVQTLSGW